MTMVENVLHMDNDSHQVARMHKKICVFVGRTCKMILFLTLQLKSRMILYFFFRV